MRYLILLTLVPALWSRPVNLYFQDVETYYGSDHELGDFYNNAALGGDYGIHSIGGYMEPFVIYGALRFPLHGPGVLYVDPGFHNFLTFQYNGYMPFSPYASLVLRYQGKVVQQILLPSTQPNESHTETIVVQGVADEIWFGVNPDGTFSGNAGDLTYTMMGIDLVDPPAAPPPPTQPPSEPVTPPQELRVMPTGTIIERGAPTLKRVVGPPIVKSPIQRETRRISPRAQSPVLRGR